MVNVLVVCKLQVGGWVYILEVRTLMLRMVFVFVVCEILQGEWASFRVRTLIGCEKHVLETTALLWVVWLYVCFVLFVGLGGARRFLLQEMPARLRFLLQIAETRA